MVIRNWGENCVECVPATVDFYSHLNQPPGSHQAGDFACSLDIPPSGMTAVCEGTATYTHASTWQMWAQVDRLDTVFEWFGEANNTLGPQQITIRPDHDADAVEDEADNCPNWANPSQTLPSYGPTVGTGPDSDCDGFTDTREVYLGTDPTQHCAANTVTNNEDPPDHWPLDMNDNRLANTIDVGVFVFTLNESNPNHPGPSSNPAFNPRHDFNGNGTINTLDIGAYVFVLNESCTPSVP